MSWTSKRTHVKKELKAINIESDDDSGAESVHSMDENDSDQNCRQAGKHENTLSLLTKKFIELLQSKPNATLDLNEAAATLNVQKRRIYDITNVMEGVGYVEKLHKNTIRWVGNTPDPEMTKETQANEE